MSISEKKAAAPAKKNSQIKVTFLRLCKNKLALISLFIFIFLVIVAIFAPLIATHDYAEMNLAQKYIKPCAEHLFGTDEYGRDIFSRVVYGSRATLLLGFAGVVLSTIGGLIIGSIAGFFGGRTDDILMRILDVVQAIPAMLMAIAVAAVLGPGIVNCVLAIVVATIPSVARLCRATILNVRGMDYVEAATSINCSYFRIIIKHVLPNAFSPLLVNATMSYSAIVMTAASLSFIGLGVQPPAAEWGALLAAARGFARSYPYMMIFPGVAMVILILVLNMMGDGLRDALDPKLKD